MNTFQRILFGLFIALTLLVGAVTVKQVKAREIHSVMRFDDPIPTCPPECPCPDCIHTTGCTRLAKCVH